MNTFGLHFARASSSQRSAGTAPFTESISNVQRVKSLCLLRSSQRQRATNERRASQLPRRKACRRQRRPWYDERDRRTLKNVWKDGTRALLLEPHDLLVRLCARCRHRGSTWFDTLGCSRATAESGPKFARKPRLLASQDVSRAANTVTHGCFACCTICSMSSFRSFLNRFFASGESLISG